MTIRELVCIVWLILASGYLATIYRIGALSLTPQKALTARISDD